MDVSLLQMRLSALVLVCMSAMTLPAQQIGTAGRLQDLDFIRTQLPQLDPFFFAQLDPARFQAAADALSASAPTVTDTDFYVGLAQLIAMAGDPHTSLYRSEERRVGKEC